MRQVFILPITESSAPIILDRSPEIKVTAMPGTPAQRGPKKMQELPTSTRAKSDGSDQDGITGASAGGILGHATWHPTASPAPGGRPTHAASVSSFAAAEEPSSRPGLGERRSSFNMRVSTTREAEFVTRY